MNALYGRGAARRSRAKRSNGSPLDPTAYEAIECFARVMVRCGHDTAATAEAFRLALAASRNEFLPPPKNVREFHDASHLVTLWRTSPDYVDELGKPLPLPMRGAGRSLESLARLVDRKLDPTEALRYLTHTHTVRKVRGRYVLSRRWVMLRGVSGAAHSYVIRMLLGKLHTVEHNLLADSDERSWFDFTTENAHFPVSQLDALDKLLRRAGLGLMWKLDLFMRHCELNRKPSEPTVWAGVGMHRFQHHTSPVFTSPAAKEGKARRTATRRRK
jgi:hypothetical protein